MPRKTKETLIVELKQLGQPVDDTSTYEQLKEQLAIAKAEMKSADATPVEASPEEEKEQAMALERAIRKYVKKGGGFRKGLPEEDIKRAKKLLKRAGREDGWDTTYIDENHRVVEDTEQ